MEPSFLLKLNRASEHLKALESEAKIWIESHPYRVVDEPDPNPLLQIAKRGSRSTYALLNHVRGHRRRFRVDHVDPVPKRISLTIGDCVHNLRSSLDHLALSLSMAFTPNMTSEQIERSEFPIFYERPMEFREERKKIGCINPDAGDTIKALQPHHRGNSYRDDPLWQIHEFDRIDKHRSLTVCGSIPFLGGDFAVGFKPHEDWNVASLPYVSVTPGELKIDAILMRYAAVPIDDKLDVKMNPEISLEVAFGDGTAAPLKPVIPTLRGLHDFIRDAVISPLSQFL